MAVIPPVAGGSSLWSGIGKLLPSVFGGIFGSSSAKKMRAFNAQEAQKQRDWQERMSNTAFQRAAADMEAAGLNRILAAGGQGSSTPSGAVASTNQTGQEPIHSALAIKNMEAQLDLMEAQTAKTTAEANLTSLKSGMLSLGGEAGKDAAKIYDMFKGLLGDKNLQDVAEGKIQQLQNKIETLYKQTGDSFDELQGQLHRAMQHWIDSTFDTGDPDLSGGKRRYKTPVGSRKRRN